MLPGPSITVPWRLLRLALALVLCVVLTACGGPGQPPRTVLLDALTLQIQLTQRSIAEALDLSSEGVPEVSRVRVRHEETIPLAEGRAVRLLGSFDWRLPGDPIRVDSPFELVLLRGERRQSWRLARSMGTDDGGEPQWITYPLPLPGEGRG
jgi:hypothetical protein